MMNRSDRQRQDGQSIVLVAVAMVALVIFVAVTVDMSNAYHHRRVAQNAADAAALAGAEELGRQINNKKPSDSRIKATMNDFAERNGIEDTNGTLADDQNTNVEGFYLDGKHDVIGVVGNGSVPGKAVGIRAITHIVAPTFFGGIMGFDGYPVQARAAVLHEIACTGGWCMLPIAIHDNGFLTAAETTAEGQCFNMWDGAGSGNFGWVNWSLNGDLGEYSCKSEELYNWDYVGDLVDDCSAQCLNINMNPDYCVRIDPNDIQVGDPVGGTTGVKNGDFIRDWLKYYIVDHGEPVEILIYDTTMGPANKGPETGCAKPTNENGLRYRTAGFACFEMTGFRLSNGKGAVQCDLGTDLDPVTGKPILHCQECTRNDDGTITCPGYSGGLVCNPSDRDDSDGVVTLDYPGDCTDLYGYDCEFETGDVNRITGKFISCVAGATGDCKAVGNVLAPTLDE
jgi:hypothetical protein